MNTKTEMTILIAENVLKYGNNWLHAISTIPFILAVTYAQLEPYCKLLYWFKNDSNWVVTGALKKLLTY